MGFPARQLQIGFHVSAAGSLTSAFDRAAALGCTTFQIFTRSPRRWSFRELQDGEVDAFLVKRSKTRFERISCHMPYLPNLASSNKLTKKLSRQSLTAEVARCDRLQIDYIVTHLGSHLGTGVEAGIANVADAVNRALSTSRGKSMILLENTAGSSNSVGGRFENLREIIDRVQDNARVGVCLDTCHLFASGFDLRSEENVKATFTRFDDIVGLENLKLVHLNDSKAELGSAIDRHEHVGMGKIGNHGFRAILHHRHLSKLPFVIETPDREEIPQAEELKLVRKLAS